jgi:3-oxoacid CoA-transferase A subunit
MAINKVWASCSEAVADIPNGASIMIGGFGGRGGIPRNLLMALRDQGAKNLTLIGNAPFIGMIQNERWIDANILLEKKQVRKVIASYPIHPSVTRRNLLEKQVLEGEVELEVMPQGNFVERIRAGGGGIAGFYTPIGVGTAFEKGKEKRTIDGTECLLEFPLKADYALLCAYKADTMGNLVYRGSARTFNPVMAPAAKITIVEVREIVEPGGLDPEVVITPGIYVDRVVKVSGGEVL